MYNHAIWFFVKMKIIENIASRSFGTFSPELLLLFLCATLSEFPKLIIDRETVFAVVSASVPTRKENNMFHMERKGPKKSSKG